ncbi:MAG: hypothetical protein GX445_06005 [Elusimicrobia bacterium]|nr:hypothetical protein [Elusimicrobiota bacterium]
MNIFKKYIPLALVFVFGIVTLASYYVPHRVSESYMEQISVWENIVFAFSLFLGAISLLYSHYNKIVKKVDGWGYSLFVYLGFIVMIVLAIVANGKISDEGQMTALGWGFNYIYNPLSATMFSVLAFYIISTAYRSFRIKSSSAFLLFIAGLILMLGNIPLGDLIWSKLLGWTHTSIASIKDWVMNVPSTAGKRGILIGVSVGAAVTSLKIIFGIERGYMGKD